MEKTISIEEFGDVILKKFTFRDKCDIRGKILTVKIDPKTKTEVTEIDSSSIFFWTTVLSIKSLPGHADFHTYTLDKRAEIISTPAMADDAEVIMNAALEFNKLNSQEIGKKNQPDVQEETD